MGHKDQTDCICSFGFQATGCITTGANLTIVSCDLSLVAGVLYLMFLVLPFNKVSINGINILIMCDKGCGVGMA